VLSVPRSRASSTRPPETEVTAPTGYDVRGSMSDPSLHAPVHFVQRSLLPYMRGFSSVRMRVLADEVPMEPAESI